MNIDDFRASLAATEPPPGTPLALAGLWWDAKGDWERAHGCAQDQDDKVGAAVHAYLHRKEGSHSNADYWYRLAGSHQKRPTLDAEWTALVEHLLTRPL
jgi:hypothetical protein